MLLTVQIHEREEKLGVYIRALASEMLSEDGIKTYAHCFKEIYSSDFRHSYAKFFPIITEIGEDKTLSLDFLSNNLEALREFVEKDYIEEHREFEGLLIPLTKLSDHLNLEIGRYCHYSEKEQRTQDLETKLANMTTSLNNAREELEKVTEKTKSVQAELITVLSIFAAIVMAFSGSMNVLGGALSGLGEVSILQSIFFLLLSGFVLFNLIFALMYFIAKITDRNIYARCETINCTCKDGKTPKCKGIERIKKRLPYVYWFNFITIILLLIDGVCMWKVGLF